MTFAHGWMLHLLWMLPLAGFALVVEQRRRRRTMERFAEASLLARLRPDDHKGKRFVKGLLLLWALGFLLLALAGPRWGKRYQEVSRRGVDIMIVVDVSRSMEVEDVKPNRLERARREIVDFLKIVEGDRVGLTAFAGAAFVQCPLTLDYAALEMFLNALQAGIIPVPGTDLGAAIETGLSAFDFEAATDKVMLLITDGEDNEQRGLEAARSAAGRGVKIFVFGIGEPAGGPIPAGGAQGGFKKDRDGKLVLSKLDEQTLRQLAVETGGGYVRSLAGDLDLDMLYFEGIKRKTDAQILKSGKIALYEERFNLFVLAAFVLLFFEDLLDAKRRPAAKRRFGFLIVPALLVLGALLWAAPARADDQADELYRKGRYEEAGKAYAKGDMDHPRDIRYRFNRGCAAFQSGQYAEASAAFASVMSRAKERDVRFKSAYNLGNTAFKQGGYASAAAYYRQALAEQPGSEDARYNLELSLKAMEQMKQPPETPQGKSERGDQKTGGQAHKDDGADEQPQGEESRERDTQPEDRRDGGGKKAPDDGEPGKESAAGEKSESKTPENRSGNLKPLQALPELKPQNDDAGGDRSAVDKQRAEALLDNVRENPAEMLQFMFSGEDRPGPGSGRDW